MTAGHPGAGGFAFLRFARDRGGTFALAAMAARFDPESRQMNEKAFLAIVDTGGGDRAGPGAKRRHDLDPR